MSTGTELITLTRDQIGFPEPVATGDDFLKDANVLRWINDGFEEMSEAINGIPVYIEFTRAVDGTLAVSFSTSTPGVAGLTTRLEDYTYIIIPNLQAFTRFRNLSPDIIATSGSLMRHMDKSDRRFAWTYESSTDYAPYVCTEGEKGFILLPKTLTSINTIGVNYRQAFWRLEAADEPNAYFSTHDEQVAVDWASYRCCVQLEMPEKAKEFLTAHEYGKAKFIREKRNRNAAGRLSMFMPLGTRISRR